LNRVTNFSVHRNCSKPTERAVNVRPSNQNIKHTRSWLVCIGVRRQILRDSERTSTRSAVISIVEDLTHPSSHWKDHFPAWHSRTKGSRMPILSILSSRFVRWQLNQINRMSKMLWGPESKFRSRDPESPGMVLAPRSSLRRPAWARSLEFSMDASGRLR